MWFGWFPRPGRPRPGEFVGWYLDKKKGRRKGRMGDGKMGNGGENERGRNAIYPKKRERKEGRREKGRERGKWNRTLSLCGKIPVVRLKKFFFHLKLNLCKTAMKNPVIFNFPLSFAPPFMDMLLNKRKAAKDFLQKKTTLAHPKTPIILALSIKNPNHPCIVDTCCHNICRVHALPTTKSVLFLFYLFPFPPGLRSLSFHVGEEKKYVIWIFGKSQRSLGWFSWLGWPHGTSDGWRCEWRRLLAGVTAAAIIVGYMFLRDYSSFIIVFRPPPYLCDGIDVMWCDKIRMRERKPHRKVQGFSFSSETLWYRTCMKLETRKLPGFWGHASAVRDLKRLEEEIKEDDTLFTSDEKEGGRECFGRVAGGRRRVGGWRVSTIWKREKKDMQDWIWDNVK